MSRALADLAPEFLPLAERLLARLVEAGIHVVIVNTRRTAEEQSAFVAAGVSWTAHSKHQDGLAIDVAPFEVWNLHGPDKLQWAENDPVWLKIGAVGEQLGLKWGVVINGKRKDLGHFEMRPREAVPRTDGFVG